MFNQYHCLWLFVKFFLITDEALSLKKYFCKIWPTTVLLIVTNLKDEKNLNKTSQCDNIS
jgi:hypothetical protein